MANYSTSPTSLDLFADDWKVIESLSGQKFNHAPKIKVRFSDSDLEYVDVVIKKCKASNPGMRPGMGDAVRLALHWWSDNCAAHPVYWVSLSQLLRDALAVYAAELSPKVQTGEGINPFPVLI